jgi:hypothetical protein
MMTMDGDTEVVAQAFDRAWAIVETDYAQHIADVDEVKTLVARRVLAAVYAGATSVEQLVDNAIAFFQAEDSPAKTQV